VRFRGTQRPPRSYEHLQQSVSCTCEALLETSEVLTVSSLEVDRFLSLFLGCVRFLLALILITCDALPELADTLS
jgi:hypothetical protein